MMPPLDGPKPNTPGRRVAPYPNEALNLGGGRWLEQTGEIVTEPSGFSCELSPKTLQYWEETALRGQGVPLNDLIEAGG